MFKNRAWRWAGGLAVTFGISLFLLFFLVLSPAGNTNSSQVIELQPDSTIASVTPSGLKLDPAAASLIGDEYMALGDSVAFGVGASPPDQSGYAAVFFNQYLKKLRPQGLTYLNLAIPGETTASFISRPRARSQLDKALAELDAAQQAGRRVSPITLTIGANDILGARLSSESVKQTTLNQFDSNFQKILDQLVAHTQGKSDIIVTTYYNPYGNGTSQGQDTAWAQRFNELINQRATERRLKVADFYQPVFGHEQELTWIANGDIHPNIQGHALLAGQIWLATGYQNKQQ